MAKTIKQLEQGGSNKLISLENAFAITVAVGLTALFIQLVNPLEVFERVRDNDRKTTLSGYNKALTIHSGDFEDEVKEYFKEICDADGNGMQANPYACIDISEKISNIKKDPFLDRDEPGTAYYVRQPSRSASYQLYTPFGEQEEISLNIPQSSLESVSALFNQEGEYIDEEEEE